jgi:hypothetical protein
MMQLFPSNQVFKSPLKNKDGIYGKEICLTLADRKIQEHQKLEGSIDQLLKNIDQLQLCSGVNERELCWYKPEGPTWFTEITHDCKY